MLHSLDLAFHRISDAGRVVGPLSEHMLLPLLFLRFFILNNPHFHYRARMTTLPGTVVP